MYYLSRSPKSTAEAFDQIEITSNGCRSWHIPILFNRFINMHFTSTPILVFQRRWSADRTYGIVKKGQQNNTKRPILACGSGKNVLAIASNKLRRLAPEIYYMYCGFVTNTTNASLAKSSNGFKAMRGKINASLLIYGQRLYLDWDRN